MLIKLDDDQMSVVDNLASMKGYVRFLDPKGYIGFDILDEDRDQPVSTEQLYTYVVSFFPGEVSFNFKCQMLVPNSIPPIQSTAFNGGAQSYIPTAQLFTFFASLLST